MYYSKSLNGFFSYAVHGNKMPEDAIELTDDEYESLLNGQAKGQRIIAGEDGRPILLSPEPPTVNDLFDYKSSEIVQKFKAAMAPVTSLYTSEEIASFPTQEPEALAWKADNTAATPLIDGILQQRTSVDKPTLVQRIIDNAANYKLVAGPAIGKKQYFEDLLFSLRTQHDDPEQPDITKPDIDAIVVDYS